MNRRTNGPAKNQAVSHRSQVLGTHHVGEFQVVLHRRTPLRAIRQRSTAPPPSNRNGSISTRLNGWNHNDEFFRFTRARFLRDEPRQLSHRYVPFNLDELGQVAIRAAQGASKGARRCVNIEKLADGMHNKAVRFTMDNGFQAVGKVPNPNAGKPHFTTASEVATMDFMRNIMGIPVPKVYSWSSTADNAVGAEYILMENVRGVQLGTLWDQLDVEIKMKVLKKVTSYQETWARTCFSQYGSLYYKQDLASSAPCVKYTDHNGGTVVDNRFAIGPSVSRQNNDDGRIDMDVDRGPWNTAEDYERATGFRELHGIRNVSRLPGSPIAIYYSGTYQPSRDKKTLAVESYLKLLKFLLPEKSLQTSHIWHNDLHTENILVNPMDPSEIYGIIDWQSTELAPLYDHTLEPYILDYDGPPLDGLMERPKLADIRALFHDEPEPIANRKANALFIDMSLVSLYRHLIRQKIPQLFKALEFRETMCFQLLLFARNLLVDGEATYLALLADQQRENWRDIPIIHHGHEPSPICFSADMLQRIDIDHTDTNSAVALMREAHEMIGNRFFCASGLVSHEEFREAQQIIPRAKAEFIHKHARNAEEALELEHAWPFQ
ncbi:hypothetical protein ABOM_001798 [Aspergillus bombycis]|uniref:Aminoglycoside phosphotransferase domain-containing protein n=1 Tax=Aspergillus bombycis TaxID=109264 RepID=A0A1F8ADK4_9EURO|nr:hypothetical protein ABOM_001798 [Aspergillus bombycis]OGM49762.1 hypothetical protein ABOM_001798 [Aspergillus bombycis]